MNFLHQSQFFDTYGKIASFCIGNRFRQMVYLCSPQCAKAAFRAGLKYFRIKIKSFICSSFLLYYIKQIDCMLPCVCSVIDHRRRPNVVRTSVAHSAITSCAYCASTTQPVHTSTQDNNVHTWARGPAKPPCRLFNIYADTYKYQALSINERTKAPKPDTKTPKNQQVEKTRVTCTPDQGSGAALGVLGYASAKPININKHK